MIGKLILHQGTRIPIPADIYETENWLKTPPAPKKSQGKK
jgi:hypothetical protein